MTEAELQRLATILHDLSAEQGLRFWQIAGYLLTFVLGIATVLFERFISYNANRKEILKTNRPKLLEDLKEFRIAYSRIFADAENNLYDSTKFEELEPIREKIKADLIAVDDRKYVRLIAPILFWNTGGKLEERLKRIKDVVRRLEKENRTLTRAIRSGKPSDT